MISKKKWIIFLVLFFIIILTIVLLNKATKPLPPASDNTQKKLKGSVNIETNHSSFIGSESDILNMTTETALNIPPSSIVKKINAVQLIMKLSEQRVSDPTIVLQIKNFSLQEQVVQKKWLASYQEKGFIETSEISFESEKLRNELVEFADLSSSSVSVTLQDVNNTKLSQYEYIGAILDKDENTNIATGVKRLYKDSDGQKISLYELSVVNTPAILVDEFVTDTIQGYPASRMTYCTEGQRCMSEITLITADKQYKVSMNGNKKATKEKLIDIISSLELPILEEL